MTTTLVFCSPANKQAYHEAKTKVGACKVRITGETDWIEILIQEGAHSDLDTSDDAQNMRAMKLGLLLDENCCEDPAMHRAAMEIVAEYAACSKTFKNRGLCGSLTSIFFFSFRTNDGMYGTQSGGITGGINENENDWMPLTMAAAMLLKQKNLLHPESAIKAFLDYV